MPLEVIRNHSKSDLLGSEFRLPFGELLGGDFALGGSVYPKKTSSVLKAIGHHSLHFIHSFEDEERYFKRDAATPDTVWECDRDRVPVKSMGLSDFNEWLAAKYGLSELGATFRDLQSLFLRAYGMGP